jgi:hypothetical protein
MFSLAYSLPEVIADINENFAVADAVTALEETLKEFCSSR